MIRTVVRNRFVFLADLVGWVLIPVALLALRLESFSAVEPYLPALGWFLLLAIPIKFAALWWRGLYSRYWRYASVDELLDIVYAVVVAVRALVYGSPAQGWPALMCAVLITSGVQLIMLGVLGEYLWRTFDETRGRPCYIVEERINC